jgi:hypothetical protein
MPHTVWHCGVLMGDADMQENPDRPQQIVGVFRATAYGREVLPRVAGLLSAAADLKAEMAASGLSEEAIQSGEDVERFLDSSPAGQALIEAGRTLVDVELRSPDGATLPFITIGFVDMEELRAVARKVGLHSTADNLESLPSDAPQFLVSATLAPAKRSVISSSRFRMS